MKKSCGKTSSTGFHGRSGHDWRVAFLAEE
jgi:hypothetical protein